MPSLITIWDILKLQKVLQLPLWSMFNNNMGYIETSLALYSQHRQLCLITIWDILKPTRASLVDDGNLFNNNMGYIETYKSYVEILSMLMFNNNMGYIETSFFKSFWNNLSV